MNPKNTFAPDLTITLSVDKSPQEAYEAIKNVRGWWIGEIEGAADEIGDEFAYRYKEFHDTTQKVTALVPGKKVAWRVTKSKIAFVKEQDEWKDTEIVFEIKPRNSGSEITFRHVGLTPAIECFKNCASGWEFYINKSLRNFITNGEGIDPKF